MYTITDVHTGEKLAEISAQSPLGALDKFAAENGIAPYYNADKLDDRVTLNSDHSITAIFGTTEVVVCPDSDSLTIEAAWRAG